MPSNKLQVLYVGRLELWKGVHLLLEAIQRINHPSIVLKLIGRVMPEMEPFLARHGDIAQVVGAMNHAELSQHLKNADIVVLPSLNDAFGMVIPEAMFHGTAVMASHASGGPDIISHGTDGILVETGSSDALVESLDWCVNNLEDVRRMGEQSRKKIFSQFLLEHYHQRLTANMKEIGFL
jgi:glycosyltransferase involved in cell wall biosynthesis